MIVDMGLRNADFKSEIRNQKSEIELVLGGPDRSLLAGWLFLIRPARGY